VSGYSGGMRTQRLTLRALMTAGLLATALLLASCGDDDSEATTPVNGGATSTETESTAPEPSGNASAPSGEAVRSQKVEIVDFAYDPDPVTIQAGGKVIWINRDSASHTATADDGSFDTGTLEQGKLKSESFKEPGTYPYFCEIHPEMRGTIEVVENG